MTKKPVIIGCCSQLGNGKDTACDYLSKKLNEIYGNGTWHRGSLASNVKRVFCEVFGVDKEFIEEWKRKDEIPPNFQKPIRQCLTFIGDGFREIRNSIWIDLLLKDNDKNLIISDARYINESNYVRSHNGFTVLLWRPGHENNINNASEQEMMPFVRALKNEPDGVIQNKEIPYNIWVKNDGTIEDLYSKIEKIVIPYVKEFCS